MIVFFYFRISLYGNWICFFNMIGMVSYLRDLYNFNWKIVFDIYEMLDGVMIRENVDCVSVFFFCIFVLYMFYFSLMVFGVIELYENWVNILFEFVFFIFFNEEIMVFLMLDNILFLDKFWEIFFIFLILVLFWVMMFLYWFKKDKKYFLRIGDINGRFC